jgi:hypothetical protein
VGSNSNIGGYCGFYFPNHRLVSNINKVGQLAAFINDDTEAFSKTLGPFYNATSTEFAPPFHPGLSANRYYSAPYTFVGDN